MQPDPDLQVAVVIKALRDVVLPSLGADNALAAEQLHLALATLDMLRSRLPLLHPIARKELENAIDLARAVKDEALEPTIARADALLRDPAAHTGAIGQVRASLLEEVSDSVNRVGGADERRSIARAVLAASRAQCDLARAWSVQGGFERNPEQLPALDALI